MFHVGDYIIYGSNGVCKVDKVGPMDFDGVSRDRMYYTLIPVYSKGSKVFTPIDNHKVVMRPILTTEEANALIDNIQSIDVMWESDDRKREEAFKEALRSCDCREWIKIVKTLYLRRKKRIEAGKKVTASDGKYLYLAEDSLYGELAVALNMKKEKVEEFIVERVKRLNKEI